MDANENNPYEQVRESVEALAPADRLRLIAELAGTLSGQLKSGTSRSLRELQGLGKGAWRGFDVDEYLCQERSSWNG